MRKIKLLSICLVILSLGTLLGGCSLQGTKTVYKYDEPEIVDGLVLTKSVYEEDKLTIYLSSNLGDDFNLDADTGEFDYEIYSNRIEITGDNLNEITAISLNNGEYRYEIRYLDSDQYAVLAYIWACDLGWDRIAGDEEDYYTAEELATFERLAKEAEESFNVNWELIKGRYESDSGEVIELYEDVEGKRYLKNVDDDYPYIVFNVKINESSVDVLCQDGPLEYWFACELAEDCTYIEVYDYTAEANIKYYKTK